MEKKTYNRRERVVEDKQDSYRRLDEDFSKASEYKPKSPPTAAELQQDKTRRSVKYFSGRVVEVGEPKEVLVKGVGRLVQKCILEDNSGRIPLSVWDDDVGKVSVGCVLLIYNGYLTEFRGSVELSAGKFGQLVIRKPSPDCGTGMFKFQSKDG